MEKSKCYMLNYRYLHYHETCLCVFGKIGKRRKKLITKLERIFKRQSVVKCEKYVQKDGKTGDELKQNLIAHTPGTNVAELGKKETMLKLLRSMK